MNYAFSYNYFKAFLIILPLFILLFSISCSNEDKTGGSDNGGGEIGTNDNTGGGGSGSEETVSHELEGTWIGYDTNHHNSKVELKIDSDGKITISPEPYLDENDLPVPYSYTGKLTVSDTFNYPFTAKVSNRLINIIYEEHECKLTFKNSSNCAADYMRAAGFKGSSFHADPTIVDFTKQ